jgi:energy-coupling factor transport system ATP-binding protein
MIELEHVSYWYPGRDEPALLDLSLTVGRGEAVAVMGRNGSGKSTLVKVVAGLIEPERGRVLLHGRPISSVPGPKQVGLLFQNPDNQMVAALVEKEIAFSLENAATPQEDMEAAITRVCNQFGLAHLRHRLTSELSGGEKQRVALASVMVLDPEILLMDEPDAFLDLEGRRILAQELQRIRTASPAPAEIRVTQSTEVARSYPRLIVMDHGVVVADGNPDEILSNRALALECGIVVPRTSDLHLAMPPRMLARGGNRLARIEMEELEFSWPMSDEVFRSVNLSLQSGELVGLIGPTGSGKSTLAQVLVGLLEATGGQVTYLSADGDQLAPAQIRGQAALVFQQPERQFFLETCLEEVTFGPTNLGFDLPVPTARQYMEVVGLKASDFAPRDPFTLSTGEKRRLAFAAVLSMEPAMVIFDEPTAGLDGDGVGRFLNLSQLLKQAGIGQLVISHDADILRRFTDRLLRLTPQKTIEELTPGNTAD